MHTPLAGATEGWAETLPRVRPEASSTGRPLGPALARREGEVWDRPEALDRRRLDVYRLLGALARRVAVGPEALDGCAACAQAGAECVQRGLRSRRHG